MRFSVVIPVHNAGKTIRRCVDSLFANTFRDMEVIAVEDGSKDDSWAVLEELAKKYPLLTILKNAENKGVSYTRNRGLEQAKGEIICFTDSDDWVEPDYLERFSETLSAYPKAFPVCGFVNHDEKYGGRRDEYRWSDFEGIKTVPLKEKLEELHQHTLLQQLWNKAFRAEVIHEHQIRFDERISIGEDFRFILDYLDKAGHQEFALINKALYHYMRDQQGSLMYQVGRDRIDETIANMEHFYRLRGLSPEEAEQRVKDNRQALLESQAYLIAHNAGMALKEKKQRILALDAAEGKALYQRNRNLYYKERIANFLKRFMPAKKE